MSETFGYRRCTPAQQNERTLRRGACGYESQRWREREGEVQGISVRRAGEKMRVKRRKKKQGGNEKRIKRNRELGNKETIKRQKREGYAEAH